jgi:hypothetical protein
VTPASNPDTVVEVVREHSPDVVIARADPADPSRLVDELRADPATEHAVVVLYE